jgi:N-acetylglucosaminyldiphosphoundecaprenol N-acetyl-beta-D-mannosaminyltransferase
MTRTHSANLRHRRLRVGSLWVDAVSFDEALRAIENLVDAGHGGAVYTPNVDHVVKAESNEGFRRAYDDVSLSLADGMPLVWVSRLLGCRLPERVAGSDILIPLMKVAAKRQWRVYLLGGGPGAAEAAARRLVDEFGVSIVGWDDCRIEKDGADPSGQSIVRARAARPDVILVGLGPPKQELWIHRYNDAVGPTVALAIGAGLDFLAGRFRRAPRWVANSGLEWAYRLLLEPRRLYRRYLIESPRFISIVFSTWMTPISERITEVSGRSDVRVPPPPNA